MLLKADILFAPEGEKKRALLVFLWIAYALITALLISNHAPWQDEALAWLIAREVGWFNIYMEAGGNVSPSLWYYILAVPAKLGFPYESMQVVHWMGACCAAGIFLFRAPFSILFKALFIFSFYIAYEHAAIARVYMPTLLLMWGVCSCYAKRYQRPILYGVLVALLAHTSFFGILIAIFLLIDFLFYREGALIREQSWAVVVMSLAILLSVLGFALDKFSWSTYVHPIYFFHPETIRDVFYFSYFAPHSEHFFPLGIKSLLWRVGPWLGVLYGVLTLWLLKRWRAYGFMSFLILSWLVIIYFSVFKYVWPGPRHYSFCLMFTVMFLWLGKVRYQAEKTRIEDFIGILFLGSFALGVLGTVAQGYRDFQLPYSGSKRMAEYLIGHKLDDNVFIGHAPVVTACILPYMPKASLWDPRKMKGVRYIHFDALTTERQGDAEVLSLVDDHFVSSGKVYLISREPVSQVALKRLRLVYSTEGYKDSLWLYVIKGAGSGKAPN
ncbi:MAG: hypothetical protein HQL21_05260 [Candidatus Omnitrophica bacterium]|nr:hypothetical protein [Candidatus Omnitrophota bacterium]